MNVLGRHTESPAAPGYVWRSELPNMAKKQSHSSSWRLLVLLKSTVGVGPNVITQKSPLRHAELHQSEVNVGV